MSLRIESIRAYRSLHRAATSTAKECGLYNRTGLVEYVRARFSQKSTKNKQQLAQAMAVLDETEAEYTRAAKSGAKGSRSRLGKLQKQRQKMLKQYQAYVSQQIDEAHELAQLLPQASENEALTSVLQVLSAGIGNTAYQTMMEQNFRSFFEFEHRRDERHEATEEATSERQNRIMQQAILPYGQRLLLAHRTAIGTNNDNSNLSYLSPWQVVEAIVGTRSNVTAHHFQLGRDHVVVEVDEAYNKQVIYVCCTRGDKMDSGSYDWSLDVERVEVSESEEIPKALVHSDYLLTASRLCDALVQETPIHPTRKTALVGHGVGGTVAFICGLILTQRGFEISNTITFGAPKAVLRGTLRERDVVALNPVRVVLAGDPLPELPVTGAEGTPFAHVGEVLILMPGSQPVDNTENPHQASSQDPNAKTDSTEGGQIRHETLSARDEPLFNAEDLATSLFMDTDEKTSSEPDEKSDPQTGVANDSTEEEPELDDEDDRNASEPYIFGETAEKNYRVNFLVENYIDYLSDPAVPLMYAEYEDDVWDEGDYAEMRGDSGGTGAV